MLSVLYANGMLFLANILECAHLLMNLLENLCMHLFSMVWFGIDYRLRLGPQNSYLCSGNLLYKILLLFLAINKEG